MEDYKIAGAGCMVGGEYGNVRVSGSCKISGDISCESIHVSGSTKSEGNIDCRAEARISGAFKCKDLSCTELRVSGSAKFGALKCGTAKVSGSVSADSIEADTVSTSGKLEVKGLLNAESITIGGGAKIGSIGCTELKVNSDCHTVKIFWGLIEVYKGEDKGLKTELIEGDKIDISYTQADIVRGADVIIGKGCRIHRVEYTGTCTVDSEATVDELEKK